MSESTPNSSGQPQAAQTGSSSETQRAYPKLWLVILLAVVAIVFTALWLGAYSLLNKAIWSNTFVTSNKWTIPVGVLFFSLLVGLAQKYLRAPTVIDGGAMAAMKGGGHDKTDYTTFPGALLKILLLGLSFKSGYLGGPTFPTLFSCTMVAMALSLLFPVIPVSILVLCIESAAVGLLLNAPLAAILLVAVVGTADPYLIALMCLSTVTAMFVGFGVKRLMAQRAADKETATPATE
jgi:H+/Cl- antiporter ClcA